MEIIRGGKFNTKVSEDSIQLWSKILESKSIQLWSKILEGKNQWNRQIRLKGI
jgi:hypothetical protein